MGPIYVALFFFIGRILESYFIFAPIKCEIKPSDIFFLVYVAIFYSGSYSRLFIFKKMILKRLAILVGKQVCQ